MLAPAFEQLRAAIELAERLLGHARRGRRIQARPPELGESGSVPFDDSGHACLAAMIGAMVG